MSTKKKHGAPPRPQRTLSLLVDPALLRGFVLGAVAVGACLYALVRAYTHPRASILANPPVIDGSAAAPSPSELPAPELERALP